MMDDSEWDAMFPPPANGQPLDELIADLVNWYGPDAVRDAVARIAKKTRGRKMETDWDEISFTLEQDAHDWLSGKDPFKIRTNYSIAKAAADANPGHSYPSTLRRLMGELAKRREHLVYLCAWSISQQHFPFDSFFRTINALNESDPSRGGYFKKSVQEKLGALAAYREQFGEPDQQMTFQMIEERLKDIDERHDS